MFWDTYAPVYDLFENICNGKVYQGFSSKVADRVQAEDSVLECAVGTGVITRKIAPRCKSLTGIDMSSGMLKRARANCSGFNNVKLEEGDIMDLKFADNSFDKVIAGNVIHLVDDPQKALSEMTRVLKPGGMLILPTYVTARGEGKGSLSIWILRKMGAKFRVEYTVDSYKRFIAENGFPNAEFDVVNGRMANVIAIIHKN